MYDPPQVPSEALGQKRQALSTSILQALAEMDAHLQAIKRAMNRIDQDGMYDAIPSESWQTRNGTDAQYLYMMFPQDRMTGRYLGPEGKRKLYVGCKTENIDDARRYASNRKEYYRLDRAARNLEYYIGSVDTGLSRLETQALRWTRWDLGAWGDESEDE